MRGSRLAPGGRNIFQLVREKRSAAAQRGVKLLDFSIGEPRGAALLSARAAAARAVLSDDEPMHSYQYNASPAVPDFARRFVAAHVGRPLEGEDVAFLPISGIKPTLGLFPLACGAAERAVKVGTMTRPGYPSPADWCALLSKVDHYALPTTPENAFRFDTADVPPDTDLLMINYPHNPSGQIATTGWLDALCRHCVAHDIRLFNDAAYCVLANDPASTTLTRVATGHPELSWAEAFTAAKLIGNGAGWHVGAVSGSPDFIGDVAVVKGKTDTGFVAPMAAGAIAAMESDRDGIERYRAMYRRRLELFCDILQRHGMRLALEPAAGFFTLWRAPTRALGRGFQDAESFNSAMIEETGVVGVPFPGYVRYAVCADIEALVPDIDAAFARAAVGYD